MIACESRHSAAENVKRTIALLEANGYTIHKIAIYCDREWGTVQNWKKTGRIEHFDWMRLSSLASSLKTFSISTTPLRP